jgi:hypothetical protein
MTATLTITGSRVTYSRGVPTRLDREIIVDLNDTTHADVEAFFQAVIDDPQLPDIGDQVSLTSPQGKTYDMFLSDRSIEQTGAGQAKVIDAYEAITVGTPGDSGNLSPIRIGGAVSSTETEVDRFGDPITVAYQNEVQGGLVQANEAAMQLSFDMAVSTYNPTSLVIAWQNKVNSVDWFEGAPGVWLCTRVNVETIQENSSPPLWKLTFEFQAKPFPGWQPWVRYINPEFGKPPPNLVLGVGYKQVEHYVGADFNLLRQG